MINKITVVIFAHNEEQNIKDCITSAKLLTDNALVVDLESNDQTRFFAQSQGANIIECKRTVYVEPAREFGINKAETDWVFILDADERITPELVQEIRNPKLETRNYTHYKIPRKNIFSKKKWLRYGGWWPDYQIRLINKQFFITWPKEIHSSPQIEGQCGILNQPFLHYFHGNFHSMVNKTIVFENIESDLLLKAGKQTSTSTFFRKFLGELYRRLIKRLGFLDGSIGIIEAIYQSFSKTITYLFLYEKKLKNRTL